MKATRHNGRSGKHGTYDANHKASNAAELAGVTISTITKWIQMEKFPCIGVGKILRIQRMEFLKFLNENREGVLNMAFIRKRGKTYSVIYRGKDDNGKERQTSEKFSTQKDAEKRKKEIEYKMAIGKFEVSHCVTVEKLIEEYVRICGHDKWGVSTYAGNISLINNYILPTIGKVELKNINTHFMEKYYKAPLDMPAVRSSRNTDGTGTVTEVTVNEIHNILRSCFRQAVKWDLMEKNPAIYATVPKAKKQEHEIWTARY